jgi:FlgD Ig-like domain
VRRALPLICLVALTAAPAGAAPSYSIGYWNGGAYIAGPTSSSSLFDSQSYSLAPSGGTGVFTGTAHCGPGYVNATGHLDCSWDGNGGFSGRVDAHTATDDLMVTGPPGNVIGTLNLRVHLDLSHSGGYLDNNGTNASFEIGVSSPYMGTVSDFLSGNHSTSGNGIFAGITSPHVDMIVPFTANFPTNVPFSLSLSIYCAGATYGGVGFSPAMAECNAGGPFDPSGDGIRLEMVNGQVMTLPAGYSFQIPSWGITNNTFVGPVSVADEQAVSGVELSLVGANPTSGDTRIALALPRDTHTRVVVYDMAGRAVREVFEGWQSAGRHELAWDGRNNAGATVAAGIYLVRAEAEGRRVALRVARLR